MTAARMGMDRNRFPIIPVPRFPLQPLPTGNVRCSATRPARGHGPLKYARMPLPRNNRYFYYVTPENSILMSGSVRGSGLAAVRRSLWRPRPHASERP